MGVDNPLSLPAVLLSHRGPVSFRRTQSGRTVRRGAGGLVTALMGLAEHLDEAVWVCAAATKEDGIVASEHEGHSVELAFEPEPRLVGTDEAFEGPSLHVRYLEVDPREHEQFYGVIANPLLWFIQHNLYGLATSPDLTAETRRAFEDGYVAVNRQFGDAVIDEVQRFDGRAVVMLHDYHFYLVGEQVRERFPDVVMSHFVHIPWPSPDAWRTLPVDMRDRILRGLLGCDVVAFHTKRYARNFLLCAQELLDLQVDLRRMTVQVGHREVAARTHPISVDVEALETLAESDAAERHRESLTESFLTDDRRLVLRVDRTDPSKNIVRGFRAFGQLLDDHPEMKGKVTFLASLQPSRQDVPEYADYLGEIGRVVAEVNARHGQEGWQPIDLRMQEDLGFALAAYALCDVLVVNPVIDGMNLVAKEMVLVNQRDGVLALSESAGAHEELGDYAVTLHPFDVQQQADALYTALTMDREQRHKRLEAAAELVRENNVERWLSAQMTDLAELGANRSGPPA